MLFLVGLLVFGILASARPTSDDNVVHEEIKRLPEGWKYVAVAALKTEITLHIALQHPHQEYLLRAEEISDPEGIRYGQYLSQDALQAILPDVDSSAEAVHTWLSAKDVNETYFLRDRITISTTVDRVSQLLDATFAWYSFQDSTPVLRTRSYSLPAHLTKEIDFIYPTVHFLTPKSRAPVALEKRQHIPSGPPNCTNSVCPSAIKEAYKIDYAPATGSSVRVGIANFLEQYGSHADLKSFLKQYGLPGHNTSYDFTEHFVNGGRNPQDPSTVGVEAMLDLEYVMAFTSSIPVTSYSTGGRPPTQTQPGNLPVNTSSSGNEPYLEFLDALLAEKNPPSVISISYSDDESTVPFRYAQKVCSKFALLAARGVSVLVASGDGGAAGSGGNLVCTGPDGRKRGFRPTFPSSCPWVTSVGGTLGVKPDQPASFSSGGFSNYFATPKWQVDAVKGYQKALGDKHKNYYNSSGRGIPDVSAMADDYLIVAGGYASAHDGTSASTPVIAAVIALLNDLRARKGLPVLGHLNPILYGKAKGGWTDVKDGQAGGCSDGDVFEEGFEAVKGWDAATGLGTPMFPKLRELLVA